jgi:flagellar biosynthesis protein FlhF
MTLKTYRARTMGDALAEVKRDLGKDAVILHTRAYKVGGWLGFGGRQMVEITAGSGMNVPPVRRVGPPSPPVPQDSTPVHAAAVARAYGVTTPPKATEPLPAGRTPVDRPRAAPASPDRSVSDIDRELDAIKRMVGQVLRSTQAAARRSAAQGATAGVVPGGDHDTLVRHYLRLMEAEVAAEVADEVIAQVRGELCAAEMEDEGIVRQTVLRHLAAVIPSDADVPGPTPVDDGRPLTIALVGPTGVGKTTTIAKLAAAYKLRHGKKVALVTIDTYRIAAVDQLRTYAEIIGLPLKVALTPSDVAGACQALTDHDVVLIDTAGRSPADAGRICELSQFIAAARPHQTHLVLSGTASEAAMLDAASKFSPVTPDRVIFTKLDEAVNYGVLFGVARRIALRLSYVTTGQEVPDHIELGRPERLARLVLDGGGPR